MINLYKNKPLSIVLVDFSFLSFDGAFYIGACIDHVRCMLTLSLRNVVFALGIPPSSQWVYTLNTVNIRHQAAYIRRSIRPKASFPSTIMIIFFKFNLLRSLCPSHLTNSKTRRRLVPLILTCGNAQHIYIYLYKHDTLSITRHYNNIVIGIHVQYYNIYLPILYIII